ncbi:putative ABC transporter ATP-binding protein YfmR [Thalassobacillus devorans]|uniref:ABC transporter ATP-binding protein YfmR n=1 Tax=Thalassobacillus devorans TaxID=279813 RepID=A0ABQ1PH50_9BACI|nr:ATP-binding cassette domain-containing protein [Thalassobacillus devorans]NIK29506.1 ATP-binding cassette subfamily F protein uup [Thalassobacillus devorans]GGC97213.1 putative ABC transporter ATP-binding protein YfmR [Thalassobacillus devorans]
MSLLQVENLTKTYGDKTLFDHISFTISQNQRIGLIGVNGTGKSTLLKVLAGLDSKEAGDMKHAKDFRIEYLHQEPKLDPDLTVLEQIYYGDSEIMKTMRAYEQSLQHLERDPENTRYQAQLLKNQQQMDENDAWEANTTAKTILTKLGIDTFDKKISALSGGQKKRVAIARALIQPADLLILDEPTNHLDNETIEWLEEHLSQYRGSLIVVTHDRYFLNRVTNLIYELDRGRLYIYEGNYETYLEKKAERDEQERISEEKRQNTLRRELAWLKRGAKARTTKQKARKQRVETLQNQSGLQTEEQMDIAIGSNRLGKKVIELENVSKRLAGETLIEDFSYLVVPEERLGIIGPNGSGKTTLLNIMSQRIEPDTGEIDVGETVKIGYYTQDHEEIDGNLKVVEYIKQVAEVITTADGQEITAEQMLERFLFPRSQQWTYIRKLSGGERRRLYLLRVLMQEPNVLFLDEPTNDLDTKTLSILEDYLDHFPGAVVTVSHDRYFLDRIADRLIAFEGRGQIKKFHGNYSEFLEEKREADRLRSMERKEQTEKEKAAQKPARKKRKLSYHEQKEWEGIEDKIADLEGRIEGLQTSIAEAGSDLGKVQEMYSEQESLETELEQAMERWEELSLLVEELENG